MVTLSLCMTIKVVSPRLKTNAFDYEDGSPWVKRTVNLTQDISLNSETSYGAKMGQGVFTIYNINSDEVIQPMNVRVSVSGRQSSNYTGDFRCIISQPGTYAVFWDSGRLSAPCVNYPVQIGGLSNESYNLQCYGYTANVYAVTVTITYDVYYKYESGGGETFTLPADWVQNTTGGSLEQPSLPTVTTAVSPADASHTLEDWAEVPQKIKDAAFALRPAIVYFFEQKYVTFVVLFLIMASLLAWFLH